MAKANDGQSPLDEAAYLIHEAAEQLGWKFESSQLIERLQRLEAGLPMEDEFASTVIWLGRCRMIHPLAQPAQPRLARKEYAVPDFLAVFEREGGPCPVLIEVKASTGTRLKRTHAYWQRLRE